VTHPEPITPAVQPSWLCRHLNVIVPALAAVAAILIPTACSTVSQTETMPPQTVDAEFVG
jgi:hypothetical protein